MAARLPEEYIQIRRILLGILALNWLVAAAKIVWGLHSRCASMTADGFHSLSDGASNIIGIIGITLAARPKDDDHPYGHKKYETFFSLGIAALLFLICFNLFKEGFSRLSLSVLPHADPSAFIVMLITLIINLGVMRYEYGKGKILQSDILISDSLHTKADIFISFSVIMTLVAIRLGYPLLDPVATLAIALFIAYSAYKIVKHCAQVLCDTAPIMEVKKIEDIVLGIKGVKTCHKIRTRGRPDDIHVDLHVQVHPDMHIDRAHKISYEIEGALKKDIPEITDVIVHMEPLERRRNNAKA